MWSLRTKMDGTQGEAPFNEGLLCAQVFHRCYFYQQRNCQAGIYISATFPSTLMLLYLGPCTPA